MIGEQNCGASKSEKRPNSWIFIAGFDVFGFQNKVSFVILFIAGKGTKYKVNTYASY